MKASSKLIFSTIFALAILLLSIFIKIIPCQTAPVIPNPQYQWSFCSANPDVNLVGIDIKYFGYTSSLTDSYIITLVLAFVVALILVSLISRKHKN